MYQEEVFLLGEWLRKYGRQEATSRRTINSTKMLEKKKLQFCVCIEFSLSNINPIFKKIYLFT